MSKAHEEVAEADLMPVEEFEYFSERQRLTEPSALRSTEDAEDFASSHNLTNQIDVLKKASLMLYSSTEDEISGLSDVELAAFSREKTHKWHQPRLLYFTIFVCALGAIEQGWAQTGMNGANLYLPGALKIDVSSTHGAFIIGLINCGLFLGQASFGAWLSEPLNNHLGRRGTIFVASFFCLFGNLGSSLSTYWPLLILCRLVLGTGLGLNSSTVNVYAAESAPAYIRGGLAVSWQLFTAFGILLGFFANVAFYNFGPKIIWRMQLATPALPALPLMLLIYVCPESASWYIKRGRYDLAYVSLQRLRNTELQGALELYSIFISRCTGTKASNDGEISYASKFKSLFTVPRNRHAMLASYTVMFSQQICGINIIAFFSSTIFSSSGFSTFAALWASVLFGAVNFLGAFPAIWSMDTIGRRRLLLWTLPPMAFTMFLISLTFNLPSGPLRFVALASLIYLFCLLYSPGMGPVPCPYSAEIYGLSVREVGMSFAISTASMWATILSLTFPELLATLGERGSFGLYAGLNILAWALCWAFVREVKGLRLNEIDLIFEETPFSFMRQKLKDVIGKWRRLETKKKGCEQIEQDDTNS